MDWRQRKREKQRGGERRRKRWWDREKAKERRDKESVLGRETVGERKMGVKKETQGEKNDQINGRERERERDRKRQKRESDGGRKREMHFIGC